jgi:hypothetical protein
MNPIQALLRHSVDYAGLFPPAGLDLERAVSNYAEYRAGRDAWLLGRFILPAGRLPEFASVADRVHEESRGPWTLSALVGPGVAGDLDRIADFGVNNSALAVIDTLETKAGTAAEIGEITGRTPPGIQIYLEIPIERDPRALVTSLRRSGARAKVRTGGVTPEAFPAADDLARFIRTCVDTRVPFKATAGLHHALRAEYPLTYDPASPRGRMFGFLNVFLATALLAHGADPAAAVSLLEEASPESIRVNAGGIAWRDHYLDLATLRRSRETIVSFGSCSFTEPLGELQALELVEPGTQPA